MQWLLGFHIIGIILWMGGLVTIGRLLGHHASLESAEARRALIPFERKSYLFAILPGFLIALLTGLGMLVFKSEGIGHYLNPSGPWGATFHAKLTLVVVLIVIDQLVFAKMRKLHRDDEGKRGFFMATHGIVGLAFIVIVLLVKTNMLG